MITVIYLIGVMFGKFSFSWWHGFLAFAMDYILFGNISKVIKVVLEA